MTIDDYLRCREIGLARLSPDGMWLAVEVRRARADAADRIEDQGGEVRSDIWVVSLASRQVRPLTHGEQDGSGVWSPIWSPDSRKLAVLTNLGRMGVRPATIDLRGGRRTVYGDRSVDLEVNFGSNGPSKPFGRVWGAWRSAEEFITALLPTGEVNWGEGMGNPARAYGPLWDRTRNGQAAVTVWDSRAVAVCGAQTSLVSIAFGAAGEVHHHVTGAIRSVTLSPSGRYAAMIVATGPRPLPPGIPTAPELAHNAYSLDLVVETALAVHEFDRSGPLEVNRDTNNLGFNDVRRHPLWAASEQSIFAPSYSADGGNRVFHADLRTQRVTAIPARSPLDAELVAALLARAGDLNNTSLADRFDLSDQQPSDTLAMTIPGRVIGMAGGIAVLRQQELVLLDGGGRPIDRLDVGGAALSAWRSPIESGGATFQSSTGTFIVSASRGELAKSAVAGPDAKARPAAADRSGRPAAWLEGDSGPVRFWVGNEATGATAPVFTLNDFLKDITRPAVRPFNYRQSSGDAALGALILPSDYNPSRRYPVVIDGYPNVVLSPDRIERQGSIGVQSFRERVLLAAKGYVVAVPSMPIPGGATPIEPLELVAGQVETFANALLDAGVAAPGRIGFYGTSYGGFAALAVAARTRAINAVVASSPFADLIAYHDLPFKSYERDACAPSRARFHALEVEAPNSALLRMAGRPDEMFARYLENSPRYQLGHSSPPVLILQGEFDTDSFRQADAVYTTLARIGVPVRLARYWGEGHVLGGPGNIKHAWLEMSDWFDTYIGHSESSGSV